MRRGVFFLAHLTVEVGGTKGVHNEQAVLLLMGVTTWRCNIYRIQRLKYSRKHTCALNVLQLYIHVQITCTYGSNELHVHVQYM